MVWIWSTLVTMNRVTLINRATTGRMKNKEKHLNLPVCLSGTSARPSLKKYYRKSLTIPNLMASPTPVVILGPYHRNKKTVVTKFSPLQMYIVLRSFRGLGNYIITHSSSTSKHYSQINCYTAIKVLCCMRPE
jgi:hypothetical protein